MMMPAHAYDAPKWDRCATAASRYAGIAASSRRLARCADWYVGQPVHRAIGVAPIKAGAAPIAEQKSAAQQQWWQQRCSPD
jgi:hypothetical protein